MEAQREKPNDVVPLPPYEAWPSVPKAPLHADGHSNAGNAMEIDSVASLDGREGRSTSVLSMDDIQAAQALEGLRADFVQSPSRQPSALPSKIDPALRGPEKSPQPEPLLSLLTSQHPLLSSAISGSLSAYTSSKSYSPRFRYSAEFMERHIGSPVASTVGTASRISGVETGVRWWLQRNDSSNMQDGSNKRRRISGNDESDRDVEKGLQEDLRERHAPRRSSDMSFTEPLPAYDDQRSPRYEEQSTDSTPDQRPMSPNSQNWQTRLMMSTSGLGVAMREESLRSLTYCLSWLRWANQHLSNVLLSLKRVLEDWEQSRPWSASDGHTASNGCQSPHQETRPRDEAAITRHIETLKADVLKTLRKIVDVVSRYAGGALPENARVLVRKHLTSLPNRFRLASSAGAHGGTDSERQGQPSETMASAQRVIVLAKEGLDMVLQVTGVVSGTIESAEEWCDRLGRRRERRTQESSTNQRSGTEKLGLHSSEADVHMTGQEEKTA